MYTRTYTEDGGMPLPEGYSGTMLEGEGSEGREPRTEEAMPASGWLRGLGSTLGSILHPAATRDLKIGTEELLIAAVALFLLFSKNGDKECAIMLLLTLFVTK